MTIVVGDLIQCNVEFELASERAMNVVGYRVSEVTDDDETTFIEALLAELVVQTNEVVSGIMGQGAFLVCCTGQRVLPGDPTRIYTKFGDGTASVLPKAGGAQLSILVSKYADPGDTPQQGRAFVPFPSESLSTDGQIDDDKETSITDDVKTWLVDELVFGTIGKAKPAIIRLIKDLPSLWSEVKEIVLRPVLASQRRRVQHHQTFFDTGP